MDQVAPLPVSAPPRVRDWLRAAPDGPVPVLHSGSHAVYVDVGGRAVGLLAAGAVQVPNGLRSRIGSLPVGAGRPAYLRGGVLHVAGRPVSVGRTVDVGVPRIPPMVPTVTDDAAGPAAVTELVGAWAAAGSAADAASSLVGRGPGLTPLGDDVVAGWLAGARALGVVTPEVDEAVRARLHRTTLLSATLLDCALHGEAVPELGDYLRSVGTAAERKRATALCGVGASSGAGLLAGSRLALRQLTARGALVG